MTTIFASDPHSAGQPWIDKVEKLRQKYPDAEIVFGGDYVDGLGQIDPKTTLNYIFNVQQTHSHTTILIGNHDDQMLRFAEDRDSIYLGDPGWLQIGGRATLKALFGKLNSFAWDRKQLKQYVLPDQATHLIDWVKTFKTYYQNDDGFFVHAYVDLNKPIENAIKSTSYDDMLWSRDIVQWSLWGDYATDWNFNQTGVPVIVGHTPTKCLRSAKVIDDVKIYGDTDCPIIKTQAPHCQPLFACDGGAKSGNQNTGNVAVFDHGRLIDMLD